MGKSSLSQVEYYFGDFNLPRDKFLQAETKTDEGWVSNTRLSPLAPHVTLTPSFAPPFTPHHP